MLRPSPPPTSPPPPPTPSAMLLGLSLCFLHALELAFSRTYEGRLLDLLLGTLFLSLCQWSRAMRNREILESLEAAFAGVV